MFSEIYEYSIQPYMVFWSILVLILGVLSLISVVSGFDADIEIDTDVEMDGDVSAESIGEGLFQNIFVFFNVGTIPVTLILFSFIISNWFLGLVGNNLLNSGHSSSMGFIIMIGVFILSIPTTKIINMPLAKVFGAMKEGDEKQNHILGNICITTTDVTNTRGQATIETQTSPMEIMVECDEGDTISKGSQAVVLKKNKETNRYIISKIDENIL